MAGTTPIYGLRYDELVDPPDGAALGKNLADDVEAELERIDAEIASVPAGILPDDGGYAYIDDTGSKIFPCGRVSVVSLTATYSLLGSPGDAVLRLPVDYRPPETIYADVVQVSGGTETALRLHVGADGYVRGQTAVPSGSVIRGSFVVPRA